MQHDVNVNSDKEINEILFLEIYWEKLSKKASAQKSRFADLFMELCQKFLKELL